MSEQPQVRRDNQPRPDDSAQEIVKRHRWPVRVWHWVNALTVFVMLMSGANQDYAWLEIGSTGTSGYLRVGGMTIPTTGVLGHWTDANGRVNRRAFPGWATIPSTYSLAAGRRWHLAFAWLLAFGLTAFMIVSLVNRHARRDLAPRLGELRPRALWHDLKQHARPRFPTGEAALRYNILQKLSYFAVLFLLLPIVILTGLTMSPGLDAAWPWLLDLFGGRQSARSIHFIAAFLLVLFVLVHLVMVILAGPVNAVRAMITGWYRVPLGKGEAR